jgi:glycosyltransferase involved in cell wall biosynthesis
MSERRTLAVDVSWLGPTGIGRVAQEVLDRCPVDWQIVPIRQSGRNAAPLTPIDLAVNIRKTAADVFWSPGFMPSLFKSGKTRVVLTVHDLTHLHYYGSLRRAYYNYIIKPLYKRADHIIAVSEFTRHELLAWSGVASSRVSMIHNGVSSMFTRDGAVREVDRPYILYAGNNRPYKNIANLVQAFATSNLPAQGIVLGLTGIRSLAHAQLEAKHKMGNHIKYFGFVPENELPALYRGALGLAFVSLYEGFGLPIIEAMACGVPVITSNVSAMPEIAGGAALLVDPNDIPSMANSLDRLAFDRELRFKLCTLGLSRAQAFSWDTTAEKYWTLFNDLEQHDRRQFRSA